MRRVPEDVRSGPGWSYDNRGWISITGNGATFERYVVKSNIDVVASNVTIRNVRSTAGGESFGISLRHARSTTIEHVEIAGPSTNRLMVGVKDIYGDSSGTRILASDISGASTAIQMGSGSVVGNYVHDLRLVPGDHVNGLTSNGATGQLDVVNNTILNPISQTDCIGLFQDFGVEANRRIEGNLLAGGGYTLYAGAGTRGRTSGIVVQNNRFSTLYYPRSGYYGPATAFESSGSGNVWRGNIWDSTGASVGAP